jgi:hypothetical protein
MWHPTRHARLQQQLRNCLGLAYLKIGQPSADAVIANRASKVAAIEAAVNTNPNLRISLTSRAALMDARLR